MTRCSRTVSAAVVETIESRRLFAAAPVVDGIANATVPIGKTIQIPVTSTSDAPLTYSVRNLSGSAQVIATLHPSSNTFVQMNVAGYSQPMVFELFNDVAPDAARRFTGLVNAGFYNGLTFHRVINNFVIQGGDPSGDGSGGPQYSFDDEFNTSAIFSGSGQLAMANSGKDTNGSQFFITEGPQRLLDFNHTIFGQLVRGEATRDAISNVSVDGNDAPLSAVTITSVKVIKDYVDAVLQVRLNNSGNYDLKVTATGANGSDARTFTVSGQTDAINDPPILDTSALQPVYYTAANTPVSIQLKSIDAEGDPVTYLAQFADAASTSNANGTFDSSTGLLTVIPKTGYVGVINVYVGVEAPGATTRGSTDADSSKLFNGIADTQLIKISVGGSQMKATAYGFDANSAAQFALATVATFRTTNPAATASNFSASIDWGDGTVTAGTIQKNRSGSYSVYGTKTYGAAASGEMPITVTVTGPDGATSTATTTADVRNFASLADGVLSVYGTSAADRIGIGRKGAYYAVTVNGQTLAFAASDVSLITAYGLAGNDSITKADQVVGAYVDGGAGNDTLSAADGANTMNGGDGDDLLYGGSGNDKMAGSDGNDTLFGGTGKDRMTGGNGNDYLDGGPGHDFLSGDAGNDTLLGGTSLDNLYGGAGDDILNGMGGPDTLDGGLGYNLTKYDPLDVIVNNSVHYA